MSTVVSNVWWVSCFIIYALKIVFTHGYSSKKQMAWADESNVSKN